jgi:2-keto-3-deoxy-L-rhamnonate aldolase RhmA
MGNPAVQEKLAAAAGRCRQLRKPCGIIGANPEMVGTFLRYGYSWAAIGSDISLMVGRAQEYLRNVRALT